MMILSRRDLEINAKFDEGLQGTFIHLIGDSKCLGSRHRAVREKGEADVMFFKGLTNLGGLVGRNPDDLRSELAELRFRVAQLNQLPVAMRSPAATVKHQDCRLCLDGRT